MRNYTALMNDAMTDARRTVDWNEQWECLVDPCSINKALRGGYTGIL